MARIENVLVGAIDRNSVITDELPPAGLAFVLFTLVFAPVTLVFVLVIVAVRSSTSGCGLNMLSGKFATGPNPGKLKVWARRARPSSDSTETAASLRERRPAALRLYGS